MGHHKAEQNPAAEEFKVGKQTDSSNQADEQLKVSGERKRDRSRPEQILHRLGALRAASGDAVKELRHGATSALGQVKGSLGKVVARFGSALQEQ